MKIRLILYSIFAISVQVIVGQLTKMGQGSLGVLIFLILVEVDPNFSFKYVISNLRNKDKK